MTSAEWGVEPELTYMGGSTGGANGDEIRWCLFLHTPLCLKYRADRQDAEEMTEFLWTSHDAISDNTRANAFKHMLWNSLMVNSDWGGRNEASRFSYLHEPNVNSDDRTERNRARMDVVNNTEGWHYAVDHERALDHNDEFFCFHALRKGRDAKYIGESRDPYRELSVGPGPLVFRVRHAEDGLLVHWIAPRDCSRL